MGVPRETTKENASSKREHLESMPSISIGVNQPSRSVRWAFNPTKPVESLMKNHLMMGLHQSVLSSQPQSTTGGHQPNGGNPLAQLSKESAQPYPDRIDSCAPHHDNRRDVPPHMAPRRRLNGAKEVVTLLPTQILEILTSRPRRPDIEETPEGPSSEGVRQVRTRARTNARMDRQYRPSRPS